ncbi:acyl-CoA dehydrogenase family protein [Candidatus Manganitrophus noduliformans]|uniref:Acyl-CoA dehydrogenase n=1 Tax=Candidatus Manganitrophus noduliformans TaxID=2606439 RepID=A0A7X6DNE3_9BACT|nr:acyl-CoA dehydrogenase family protein [Candidatus Manganitrophus noduliformans]NKE70456.1 acyl-CoA dehydrogenase [Candidatus Manganitrophus noduliformans]
MPLLDLSEILRRTEEIAREVVAPSAEAVDREGRWPEANLRALQQAGLGGLVIPRESGGLGQGLFALARVCETLGRVCGSTAMCFGMHHVGSAVLAAKATADQKERYLIPINEGRHLTTLALSEPGTGSQFYIPQTRLAEISSDLFQVSGVKSFVTNGGHADSYVISTVAASPNAPPGQFSCVVLPGQAPGMIWQESWKGVGMRGNASRTVEMKNVEVPRRDLLGNEGEEIWYLFTVIAPHFLMAMAGTYIGIAAAALEEIKAHLTRRRQAHSGATLGQQTLIQHRFGALWAEVERTRRLIYHAASQGDAGSADVLPALCSAKAEVADCAVHVANEAMTLAGGIAYREGSILQRCLRDARAAHVMAPTTDNLRIWVGRALLGQPLLGD